MPNNSAFPDVAIEQVAVDLLDRAWPLMEPLLAKGLATDPEAVDLATLYARVLSGHFQLWAVVVGDPPEIAAAVTTFVKSTPRGQVVVIDTLGGRDMSAWLQAALSEFEAIARRRGMVAVQIEGRTGWSRRLPDYTVAKLTLEKRL